MRNKSRKYLHYLNPFELLQTKKVLRNNPNEAKIFSSEKKNYPYTLYSYNPVEYNSKIIENGSDIDFNIFSNNKFHWLNGDISNKEFVHTITQKLDIHFLVYEDIISVHQRPKVEEYENYYVCILHMLYFKEEQDGVLNEQVTFVLGKNFLITFQDDSIQDPFNIAREKLTLKNSKLRQQGVDYLMYILLDAIVDNYFTVLEMIGDRIEKLEEEILQGKGVQGTMYKINSLRKQLILYKRNTAPVRELLSNIIRSDHRFFEERNRKYYRDIYDHIIQITELTENYRDMVSNLRDLYFSHTNLKLNEIMKFLAIVTTLLAPATVIGGIFGMNFDRIPYLHHQNGFWIATGLMIIFPLLMLYYFKRKDWY